LNEEQVQITTSHVMTIKFKKFHRSSRLPAREEDLTDSEHQEGHFSLDLESRCIRHFEFLKALHEAGVTKRVTSESLRRYLLWLNLLAKVHQEGSTTNLLIPPKDVAWLWHCHRLAPEKYEEFLQETCMAAMRITRTSAMLKARNAILDWKDPAGDPYAVYIT
jgi:hypothetical protein